MKLRISKYDAEHHVRIHDNFSYYDIPPYYSKDGDLECFLYREEGDAYQSWVSINDYFSYKQI